MNIFGSKLGLLLLISYPTFSISQPGRAKVFNGGKPKDILPSIVYLSDSGGLFCSGNIIEPDVIVTAAHCFEDSQCNTLDPCTLTAGQQSLDFRTNATQVKTISRQRVFVHEEYNKHTMANDIALIFLSSPLNLTNEVKTISYRKNPEIYEGRFQIAGWGSTYEGSGMSKELLTAYINSVPLENCTEAYRTIPDKVTCAKDHRTDVCKGDSGGPLYSKIYSTTYVLGIVSYGGVCNDTETLPGVYTNISQFANWIKLRILKDRFDCGKGLFTCHEEKKCISADWRCDGMKDCKNGEDEHLCTYSCPQGYSPCSRQMKCIPDAFICDDEADCDEGDDEWHCSAISQLTPKCDDFCDPSSNDNSANKAVSQCCRGFATTTSRDGYCLIGNRAVCIQDEKFRVHIGPKVSK